MMSNFTSYKIYIYNKRIPQKLEQISRIKIHFIFMHQRKIEARFCKSWLDFSRSKTLKTATKIVAWFWKILKHQFWVNSPQDRYWSLDEMTLHNMPNLSIEPTVNLVCAYKLLVFLSIINHVSIATTLNFWNAPFHFF